MQNNNTQAQNQNKDKGRSKFIKTSKPEIAKAHKEEFDHKAEMKQQNAQSSRPGTAAAVSTALINEVASFAPNIVEEILQKLGERFGEERIEKFSALLGGKTEGAEGSLMSVIRAALPVSEEISLENLPQLANWDAVKKRISKNPVMVASAVVAGVGALYVAREYLNSNGDFSLKSLLPEGLNAQKTTGRKKMMAMSSGSSKARSSSRSSSTKRSKSATRSKKK